MIKLEITITGLILRIHNLNGRYYKLSIGPLYDEIIPEKCTTRIRSKGITLHLQKRAKKTWSKLLEDKKAKKALPKVDKDADPNQSLMEMMKGMYQDGDDDMRRMMNKAWVESQEKKAKGGMDDFSKF